MSNSPKHRVHSSSISPVHITILVISLLLLGIGIYFIVLAETKDEKHPRRNPPYHPRERCNRSAGYEWSDRLHRCVRGYRN